MAMALQGWQNATIVGCDTDVNVRRMVVEDGTVSKVYAEPKNVIKDSDLVIVALYPELIVPLIRDNAEYFKEGAVLTEICGVKTALEQQILDVLPERVDYVGSHPMAGKEVEGFSNADVDLFQGTGFIVTVSPKTKPESIRLITDMAIYIGAARVVSASAETHDAIIAYTSDLMHIAASALCLDVHEDINLAFTAGAYRDCTRIAMINPELWSELLLANRTHVINELARFTKSLNKITTAIVDNDKDSLFELLSTVRANKGDLR